MLEVAASGDKTRDEEYAHACALILENSNGWLNLLFVQSISFLLSSLVRQSFTSFPLLGTRASEQRVQQLLSPRAAQHLLLIRYAVPERLPQRKDRRLRGRFARETSRSDCHDGTREESSLCSRRL